MDECGTQLNAIDYRSFRDCNIAQLDIKRETSLQYSCSPPSGVSDWNLVRMRKWTRAFLNIVICAPELEIGSSHWVAPALTLQSPLTMSYVYDWRYRDDGLVHGTTRVGEST